MICTCSQCSASDYDEPQDDSWLDVKPAQHEITTPEQDRERLMKALAGLDNMFSEYQRRSRQSLGEWLAENMKERQS
jgi:hypothetical protein